MNGHAVQWSDLPLVLTSEQVAAVLQLKRRTVANMLNRGELRGVKVGKGWRVSRAALMQFMEGARLTGELRPQEIVNAGGNGAQAKAEPQVEALQTEAAQPEPSSQTQAAAAEPGPVWEHDAIFNIIGLGTGGPPDLSSRHHDYLAQALEEEWHSASS